MEGTWFSGVADELARCVADAQVCAEACEALLESTRSAGDGESRRIARALVPPIAIARVLGDLVDQPPELVLAACRLYSDSARDAIDSLDALGREAPTVVAALRTSVASCAELLDAVV